MSSTGVNIDKPLELIQKTYYIQTTTNNDETSPQSRPSHGKGSFHQLSRKTSVHDVHEVTRDHLNKILADIHENLSRLKILLETMNSAQIIRDEFFKSKDQLFIKINDFIHKLANESGKRGSIISKRNSLNLLTDHPQQIVYCIEYFRNELVKAHYLFSSLTLSASIGTATLNSITVKSLFHPNIDFTPNNNQDIQFFQDINQIKKDISNLEEHIYVLNQRYYNQIPDGNQIGDDRILNNSDGLNFHRFRLGHKLSTTSSAASNEHSNICGHFYQKCQILCCICKPNYL